MSAEQFPEFEVCRPCRGRGHWGTGSLDDPLRDCPACEGDRVVLTVIERAAREAAKTTGVALEDAREMLRKAAEVQTAPAGGYGNTIKRDGATFATVASWPDALAVAQSMSAVYKRARFEASGALGQAKTYRAGRVVS